VILFPAIDLKQGQAVRLKLGDMAQATVFNDDPAAQAKAFESQGFEYLHVVDLDGAFAGKGLELLWVDDPVDAFFLEIQGSGRVKLREGGILHLATDWQDYAEHMRAVLAESDRFRPLHTEALVPRPESRAETHFERRGLKLGHAVSDLLYQRC